MTSEKLQALQPVLLRTKFNQSLYGAEMAIVREMQAITQSRAILKADRRKT